MNTHVDVLVNAVIAHPSFEDGLKKIERVHRMSGQRPRGLLLLGETGVGKTTLLNHYVGAYLRQKSVQPGEHPILQMELGSRTTVKSVLTDAICALGGIPPKRPAEYELMHQLKTLLAEMKCSLLIIDEAHHLTASRQGTDVLAVADSIKSLMNKADISIILSGLPHAENAFIGHQELARRFRQKVVLMDFTAVHSWKEFSSFVSALLELLGVVAAGLKDIETYKALYIASHGKPSAISDLLIEALEEMADEGDFALSKNHLSAAFESFSADINPFMQSDAWLDACMNQEAKAS